MRIASVVVAAATLLSGAADARQHPAAETRAAIARALADPARADQAADDDRRKAAEVVAFAGAGPGDTVLDFFPGAGYWTRIFSGVVGAKGKVYALWPKAAAGYADKALPGLKARGLANVTAQVMPGNLPVAPAPVDIVWTAQNYHDVPPALIGPFNAAVFKVLKPGGTYVVIDHADAPGAPYDKARHRIDPATVKTQVVAAGFRFVGESDVLRNPADDHSRVVFDPAIRGRTDQFVYVFRKP